MPILINHDYEVYEWNATRNANGSFHCYDCGKLIVLFDDDTHEHWRPINNPSWGEVAVAGEQVLYAHDESDDPDSTFGQIVEQQRHAQCPECLRRFDLMDEIDAQEWFYGHDCEK